MGVTKGHARGLDYGCKPESSSFSGCRTLPKPQANFAGNPALSDSNPIAMICLAFRGLGFRVSVFFMGPFLQGFRV